VTPAAGRSSRSQAGRSASRRGSPSPDPGLPRGSPSPILLAHPILQPRIAHRSSWCLFSSLASPILTSARPAGRDRPPHPGPPSGSPLRRLAEHRRPILAHPVDRPDLRGRPLRHGEDRARQRPDPPARSQTRAARAGSPLPTGLPAGAIPPPAAGAPHLHLVEPRDRPPRSSSRPRPTAQGRSCSRRQDRPHLRLIEQQDRPAPRRDQGAILARAPILQTRIALVHLVKHRRLLRHGEDRLASAWSSSWIAQRPDPQPAAGRRSSSGGAPLLPPSQAAGSPPARSGPGAGSPRLRLTDQRRWGDPRHAPPTLRLTTDKGPILPPAAGYRPSRCGSPDRPRPHPTLLDPRHPPRQPGSGKSESDFRIVNDPLSRYDAHIVLL
jgi:hypothetical protein